ncbi:MAG: hypothetical protein OXC19_08575 [Bryobacterales bacterium]|nr:hypothetical protein [Bryobacterales bacterium]
MRAKTRVLLAVVIVSNALGNVSLGYGMREIGDISSYSPVDLVSSGIAGLANPWVLTGVLLLCLFFAAHTLLLSWADLSYVLLVTSLGYVLVAIMSAAILDEAITPARWVGTLLIALGVGVVGSTPVSTLRGGE